jgi:hypothetical protein
VEKKTTHDLHGGANQQQARRLHADTDQGLRAQIQKFDNQDNTFSNELTTA